MTKLVFGCGYLGGRVAARWRDAGHNVVVVTRSAGRAEVFKRQGLGTIVADVTRPEMLHHLPTAETVLLAVGNDRTTGQTINEVYAGGMRNVLAALPAETGRFIYISTTGVYGTAGGEWIDEDTPTDPQREGGKASLVAEEALAAHLLGARSIVLRLAGLYGPGRVPFLKELREGEPIPAPSTGHLNLIHVDDAAAVVAAAADVRLDELDKLNRPSAVSSGPNGKPRIYCVSDGHPVERGEFYREVARQIGAPPPQFVEPDPSSTRAARASANRRIRNDRMMAVLRVKLTYPDYRVGLGALLETQNQ